MVNTVQNIITIESVDALSLQIQQDFEALQRNENFATKVDSFVKLQYNMIPQVRKCAVEMGTQSALGGYKRQVDHCRELIPRMSTSRNVITDDDGLSQTDSASYTHNNHYRSLSAYSLGTARESKSKALRLSCPESSHSRDEDRTPTQANFLPVSLTATATPSRIEPPVQTPSYYEDYSPATPTFDSYNRFPVDEPAPMTFPHVLNPPSTSAATQAKTFVSPSQSYAITKTQITHWLVQNIPSRQQPMSKRTFDLIQASVIAATPTPPTSRSSSLCCQCEACALDLRQNTFCAPDYANSCGFAGEHPFASFERFPLLSMSPQQHGRV